MNISTALPTNWCNISKHASSPTSLNAIRDLNDQESKRAQELPIIMRLFIGKKLWSIRSRGVVEGVKQSGISPLRRSVDQSRAGSIDPPYWELDKSQSISVDIATISSCFHVLVRLPVVPQAHDKYSFNCREVAPVPLLFMVPAERVHGF